MLAVFIKILIKSIPLIISLLIGGLQYLFPGGKHIYCESKDMISDAPYRRWEIIAVVIRMFSIAIMSYAGYRLLNLCNGRYFYSNYYFINAANSYSLILLAILLGLTTGGLLKNLIMNIVLGIYYQDYVKYQSRQYGIDAANLGDIGRGVFMVVFGVCLYIIER